MLLIAVQAVIGAMIVAYVHRLRRTWLPRINFAYQAKFGKPHRVQGAPMKVALALAQGGGVLIVVIAIAKAVH